MTKPSVAKLCAGIIACLCASSAIAQPFTVQDIRVEGLQRVSASTVFSYLPIKVGDTVDVNNASHAVVDLYRANLFSNVKLAQDGTTLVVQITEFPVVGAIEFEGNSVLSAKSMREAFAKQGFAEGQPYNPASLNDMLNQLYEQYEGKSKFQVKIQPKVETLPRGRVSIKFIIDEGRTGRIREVDFVGNHIYDDEQLRRLMESSSTNWKSWLLKDDQLNGNRLQQDMKHLEDFYLNRGFIDFRINSVQTNLSEDKTKIFLTINLTEGQAFTISGYNLTGNLIVPKAELEQMIAFKTGELYNRSLVEKTTKAIQKRLADEGRALAKVTVVPDIDHLTQKVFLNLDVIPGDRYVVRRVEFTGNNKSYDSVLRREMRQMEMAPYSESDLERSEQRLRRLPQVEDLEKTIRPVEGKPDQVDVVYKVKERGTSYIQGGIGYGQSSGALFSLEYTDDNFLGSGDRLNLNISHGSYQQSYGITYTDPYFTENGVSASFSFNWDKYDFDEEDLSDWSSDNLSAMVQFGFPISEYKSVYFGGGYRNIRVHLGTDVAPEIRWDVKQKGDRYNEYVLNSRWTRDTTDSAFFPTVGTYNSIDGEITVPGSDETYYRLNYDTKAYFSKADATSLVLALRGKINYGDGYGDTKNGLPFYRRYYAGGINTVRGYQYASIGPRYINGDHAGGDFRAVGSIELIKPISWDGRTNNIRVGVFADGGSVWSKFSDVDTNDLRYSAGVFFQWLSPIGPLNLSYGIPLNDKDGDKRESFQFTIGTFAR